MTRGPASSLKVQVPSGVPGWDPTWLTIRGSASAVIFCTGSIGYAPNKYQFRTAEYRYTYGQPSPLASAFIAHLTNPAAVSDLTSGGYLPCPPGSSGTAAALCKLAGT